ALTFDPRRYLSEIATVKTPGTEDLSGTIVHIGGPWSVVKFSSRSGLTVWGKITDKAARVEVLDRYGADDAGRSAARRVREKQLRTTGAGSAVGLPPPRPRPGWAFRGMPGLIRRRRGRAVAGAAALEARRWPPPSTRPSGPSPAPSAPGRCPP